MITAPAGRVFPSACSGTHFPALKRQGLAAGDPCSLTSGRTGTSFLPARTRPGQRLVLIRFTPIICAFPPFVNPPTFLKESRQRTFPSRGFSSARSSLDGRDWFFSFGFPFFYAFPRENPGKELFLRGVFLVPRFPRVAAIGYFFFWKEKGETPVCLPWIGWILFFRRSAGPLLPWNAPCGDAPTVPRSSRGARSWRKRTCRDSGRR